VALGVVLGVVLGEAEVVVGVGVGVAVPVVVGVGVGVGVAAASNTLVTPGPGGGKLGSLVRIQPSAVSTAGVVSAAPTFEIVQEPRLPSAFTVAV